MRRVVGGLDEMRELSHSERGDFIALSGVDVSGARGVTGK